MTGQSAFDKKGIEDDAYVEPSGILDHLNLPAGFVRFVRENKKALQIGLTVIAVIVVVSSLYSSYRVNRIQNAAASLARALQAEETSRINDLEKVANDFSSTPGAIWAKVELAHKALAAGSHKEAADGYKEVRGELSKSDPLLPLLSYSIAQVEEAAGNNDQAIIEYTSLQKESGYESLAYDGLARIYKIKGDNKQALATYEEYLSSFTGVQQNSPEKIELEEKIARLKATM